MLEAATSGQIGILKMMLERGADYYADSLVQAIFNNHIEIVRLLLEKHIYYDVGSYDCFLYNVINKGNTEIVRLLLQKMEGEGITPDYDAAAYNAAHAGHIDIVKLMLDKGCTNYNNILVGAAYGHGYSCHANIIQLMLEKGADNYNDILKEAKSINCRVMIDTLKLARKNYSK
jgi:ankyrin repeat protein